MAICHDKKNVYDLEKLFVALVGFDWKEVKKENIEKAILNVGSPDGITNIGEFMVSVKYDLYLLSIFKNDKKVGSTGIGVVPDSVNRNQCGQ